MVKNSELSIGTLKRHFSSRDQAKRIFNEDVFLIRNVLESGIHVHHVRFLKARFVDLDLKMIFLVSYNVSVT